MDAELVLEDLEVYIETRLDDLGKGDVFDELFKLLTRIKELRKET